LTAIVGELRHHIHRARFRAFQDLARLKEREIMCHHNIARQGVRKIMCMQEENTFPQYSVGRMLLKYHRGHWGGQQDLTGPEKNCNKPEACTGSQTTTILSRSSTFAIPKLAGKMRHMYTRNRRCQYGNQRNLCNRIR